MATVPQPEILIKYDPPEKNELAKQSSPLAERMAGAKITNQETLDAAVELKRAGQSWIEKWDLIFNPLREATHKAWKLAVSTQDDGKREVELGVRMLGSKITGYLEQKRREDEEKQRKLDAEQARINKENADKQAALAKKAGADKETIKDVKQTVLSTAAPTVAPSVEKPKGVSISYRWDIEIEHMGKFLAAIAVDKTLLAIFVGSEPIKAAIKTEFRKLAVQQKEGFKIAGARAFKKPISSDRGA